jgi:hypothetical protein
MAVFIFLESYNFSGKAIYPLVTHGGSRFGRSLMELCRGGRPVSLNPEADAMLKAARPGNGREILIEKGK